MRRAEELKREKHQALGDWDELGNLESLGRHTLRGLTTVFPESGTQALLD